MITMPKGGELEFSKKISCKSNSNQEPNFTRVSSMWKSLHVIVVGDKDNTFIAQSSIQSMHVWLCLQKYIASALISI